MVLRVLLSSLHPPSLSSHPYMTTLCCSISLLPLACILAVGAGACKETPKKCIETWDCRKPGWLPLFTDDYSCGGGQTSWYHSVSEEAPREWPHFYFSPFFLFVCLKDHLPCNLQQKATEQTTPQWMHHTVVACLLTCSFPQQLWDFLSTWECIRKFVLPTAMFTGWVVTIPSALFCGCAQATVPWDHIVTPLNGSTGLNLCVLFS